MSAQEKKEAYHEAKVMSAFDHPNIIKFKDVYTTTNGKLNIVMNYADGGDLSSKIRGQKGKLFTENEILDIFVQVCLAIKHVHDRKVLHRDIKAQNIFLMKSGMIKLGDFGISKVLNNTVDKARTMVGTPYYLSPEIVENRPYSFKSDVWSLGVLLYELCALKPPFDGTSIRHLGLNIVKGIFTPVQPHFSKDLKILIAQMLTVDTNRRPTVAQVLRMPFIKARIQNLLSESTRFDEFSHTILHKQQLFAPKKEPAKEVKKEPVKEVKKEPPKIELKKESPIIQEKKVERKENPLVLPNFAKEIPEKNNFTPKPRIIDIKDYKKPENINPVRKVYEIQEIPKFNENNAKKLNEKKINENKINENLINENKLYENKDYKPIEKLLNKPSAKPPMFGRLEDVFKPVEKPAPRKSDPISIQEREDVKKKKELEAKKKLDELMKKREDYKLEAIARKEAAEKKKAEKLKKINEDREKMRNDIKQKKNFRNSSDPIQPMLVEPETPVIEEKKSERQSMGSSAAKEKPKYDDQRKKMIEALRKNPKKKQKNGEFVIEWAGVKNPEEQRMIIALQNAITEESISEGNVSEEDIYITEIPDEEIIDREDEIADKVIVPIEKSDYEIGSTYNSLEELRDFLEEKMGYEMLVQAVNVIKGLGDVDLTTLGENVFYEKLGTIIPLRNMEEYVSYLKTLMIVEKNADSYLDGIINHK